MDTPEQRETERSRRSHGPDEDPRDIVTEYAFQVDPELLGMPLAGPFRRLAGILLDLLVLALLFPFRAVLGEFLGIGGIVNFLVAAAVAWMLWRLASPRWGRTPSKGVRVLLTTAAVVIALVGVGELLSGGGDDDEAERAEDIGDAMAEVEEATGDLPPETRAALREQTDVDIGAIVGSVGELIALSRAGSPEEAQPIADRVALQLYRQGVPANEVARALEQALAEDSATAWMSRVAARAASKVDSVVRERRAASDSTVLRYARAVEASDTIAADSLHPALVDALAGEEIRELRGENRRLRSELNEATSTRGFVSRGMDIITEDLGIGAGWLGLYFTAFLALWNGRTPGKRLVGTRVVHLDGEPIGWWDAFGRFGGYAAGLATGTLGFLQIFWDPNRQGIHDRIARTVVVRTRGVPER